MLENIRKNSVTLAIFAIVMTAISALLYHVTNPVVRHQVVVQKQRLLNQIIPKNLYDNPMQEECYAITNSMLGDHQQHHLYLARKDGLPVAAAIETIAPDGYSGTISMIVGVNFFGKVYGVRVLKHHETPGLGDKIDLNVSDWITVFKNKIVKHNHNEIFAIKQDGGIFDQFTGATITPRAVVNATKRTAILARDIPKKLSSLNSCEIYTDEKY
jgi:electron transport complex protein RnfG